MNLTHIIRGAVVLLPAIILGDVARRVYGTIPMQVVGIVSGFLIGGFVVYWLGRPRKPRAGDSGGSKSES